MIITISGLPGSGTSTTTKSLAKKLGYEYVNAGKIQRDIALEKGVDVVYLNKFEEKDRAFDDMVDKRTIETAQKNKDIILEGRLTGWMMDRNNIKSFKIWISCPLDERIQRISKRDQESIDLTEKKTKIREKSEAKRFKEYYNIDISDLSIYDLEVNSNNNSPDKTVGIILNKINKL